MSLLKRNKRLVSIDELVVDPVGFRGFTRGQLQGESRNDHCHASAGDRHRRCATENRSDVVEAGGGLRFSVKPKTGQPMTDTGKYIVVFKKEGADWKISHDVFNSDLPPPPAK